MSSETQQVPELFDAPVIFVEARYRGRALAARVLHARSARPFTIGAARGADAPVDPRYLPDELPANDNHALVAWRGAGFVIDLPPALRGGVERSPARLRVPCGEVVFDITAAAAPPPVPRPWLGARWREDARITGAVALGLLAILALVSAVPSDPHALSFDDVGRSVRLDLARVVPPVPVPPPVVAKGPGAAAGGGAARPSGGPPGAAGDPRAPRVDGRRATKGPAERQDARAVEAAVRANSLLAILDGQRSTVVAEVFADRPALGDHADDVLAHVVGRDVTSAFGAHGLGPLGTGRGGADTGRAMLGGPGRLGTIGLRHGPGGPGLDDDGGGALAARQARAPEITTTAPSVRGGLDKEIVRRVVRRHLNEVRYCYEEELARRPTLAGRVVAMFTIAPDGIVRIAALQSSTLGSPAVETCIVAATRRWTFPQPAGGGLVTVSYPFQLAPAGG